MRYTRSFTLQEFCLDRIIEYLDLYIYNEVFVPQNHIDVLLRLYPKECFTLYTFSHSKTEECLLWFLSSCNKNVFLPSITQNIMEKLQIVGPALTSLTLQETMASENVLNSVICCVPHLTDLDLSHTNCSDNTLLCIQKMCPELVTLNVQDCENVTDSGMLNLCGNNLSLKNLNILSTSVDYNGLHDILVGMPSLQCLTYYNMAESFHYIFESGLQSHVQKNIKYNLTELIYEDPEFALSPESVIWTWLVLCPKIEKVCIMFPVRQHVLQMCSRFLHLKDFELKRTRFDLNDMDILDPLTPLISVAENLNILRLSHVEIPSVTLIERFKKVKSLYLNGVTFTDFNEDEIISRTTSFKSLTIKGLRLDVTGVTYKFLVLLFSLSKGVTELVISNMAYFPGDLVDIILNSMKKLIFVEFSFIRTKLPSSSFSFFQIPTVKRIYIDGCMDPFLGPIHFSTNLCTLSWRIMSDIDDDDYLSDFEDNEFFDNEL